MTMWRIKNPELRAKKESEEKEFKKMTDLVLKFKTEYESYIPIENKKYCKACKKEFKSYKNTVKHFNTKTHIKKKESFDKRTKKEVEKYLIPDVAEIVNSYAIEETFHEKNKKIDLQMFQAAKKYYLADLKVAKKRTNASTFWYSHSFFRIDLKAEYNKEQLQDLIKIFQDQQNLTIRYRFDTELFNYIRIFYDRYNHYSMDGPRHVVTFW